MRARILPRDEWGRLPAGKIPFLDQVGPEDIDVLVVESAGDIIACAAVVKLIHLESAWISPMVKGNPGVCRALLRQVVRAIHRRTQSFVLAATDHPTIMRLLEKIGGQRLYVRPDTAAYAVQVEGSKWQ